MTLDGVRIGVSINAGLLVDLQHLADADVDGVGLYRTEVPFMVRSELPNVEVQRGIYRKVLDIRRAASRWSSARSTSAATR